MNVDKNILRDNEGESIGSANNYVQQYKDIEAGKRSTAKSLDSFSSTARGSKPLPKKWEKETEKEILLHYCKRFGCTDYTDLEDKGGQIAAAINRLYEAGLTPGIIADKVSEHITPDDLFEEETTLTPSLPPEKAKSRRKLNVSLSEFKYGYKKGLEPLTPEQLDLCRFIDPTHLVFSSDEYSFFLAVVPGKEKSFDKLFNFSPREELVYEMFKEQLGDEHKAKKLVLMSRLMNEPDTVKTAKKVTSKKVSKKKTTKKKTTHKASNHGRN